MEDHLMKRMRELAGRELLWAQPKAMKREFELKDGEELVATLQFRTTFGSFATAETGDGSWTFKRVGFLQTHVTICPAGSDEAIAVFRNNTWKSGGTLEFPTGRTLRATSGFWRTKVEFMTESDEALVRLHRVAGVIHLSAHVEITPAGAELTELPWLVALGWYLAVKMHDDAGAGAAS
jgi:hypothetical protein